MSNQSSQKEILVSSTRMTGGSAVATNGGNIRADREQEIFDAQQAELRSKASDVVDRQGVPTKFGEIAPKLHYTRSGLEMASRYKVAQDRFQRVCELKPSSVVADITAGIGGDTLVLAEMGCKVTGYEIDQVTYKILEHNMRVVNTLYSTPSLRGFVEPVANHKKVTLQSTINESATLDNLPDGLDLIFADPMRRSNNKRAINITDYTPSLPDIFELFANYIKQQGMPLRSQLLIKLSPATDQKTLSDIIALFQQKVMNYPAFSTEILHYSIDGDSVETCLHFKPFATTANEINESAVIINTNSNTVVTLVNTAELQNNPEPREISDVTHLIEPNSAINSAGLGEQFRQLLADKCADLGIGAEFISTETAYILAQIDYANTSKMQEITDFITTYGSKFYQIEQINPYQPKKLLQYAKEFIDISTQNNYFITDFEVKKRGLDVDVHKLQGELNKLAKRSKTATSEVQNNAQNVSRQKLRATLIILPFTNFTNFHKTSVIFGYNMLYLK